MYKMMPIDAQQKTPTANCPLPTAHERGALA